MTAQAWHVRAARADDVPALLELLNEIVRVGGTTAIEEPIDAAGFRAWFTEGPDHVSCFVVEDVDGRLLGFQSLCRKASLPSGCVDIATFARREPKVPGVGRALFEATSRFAREAGLLGIDATIRADNVGGLAYYARMGFVDRARTPAVPLADGTPVDRLSKRYIP